MATNTTTKNSSTNTTTTTTTTDSSNTVNSIENLQKDETNDPYCFYDPSNASGLFDQFKHNASERDKLISFMSGIFIAATATIFNLKSFNAVGVFAISAVLIVFTVSLGFSLYSFHVACKSSKYQYKLFCKGLNNIEKRITYDSYIKKVKKIRKKYKPEYIDSIAIYFCLFGVVLFVCFAIYLAYNAMY